MAPRTVLSIRTTYLPPLPRLSSTVGWGCVACNWISKSLKTSPFSVRMLRLALMSGGKVTSISPFIELKDIALPGLTRLKVTRSFPFRAWATALPEMFVSVTLPFTSLTSSSPSTPLTMMLPLLTVWSESDVCTGTVMVRSTGRRVESAEIRTSLLSESASTDKPVAVMGMRRRWPSGFSSSSPSSWCVRACPSTIISLMSAPLTVMLPLNRCARTWAGREGSPRGTLMRLSEEVSAANSCAPSIRVARTAKINSVYSMGRFIDYLLAFKNAYVSIQIVCFDFQPPATDPASGITIGAKNEFTVMAFARCCFDRQRSHWKVAIDVAVHRLEAKVSGQPTGKVELHRPVDGAEVGVFLGILPKHDLHSPVDGASEGFPAAHVLHVDPAIHVMHGEVADHVADAHTP